MRRVVSVHVDVRSDWWMCVSRGVICFAVGGVRSLILGNGNLRSNPKK